MVRKVQTTNGIAFTVRYSWDKARQLIGMVYPDGSEVDYTRNALGQITGVGVTRPGQGRQVLLSGAGYLPFGPSTGWTYGNGRVMARTFDSDYRPLTIQDASAGGLSLGFGYDAVGNLTKLGTAAGVTSPAITFGYDTLGRLTRTEDGPTAVAIDAYSYDATGNRLSHTTATGTSVYSYPSNSHHLTDVGGTVRSYDAAGNTTTIGTGREFVYSEASRMSQVKNSGIAAMNYSYNGRGEQVRRHLGSASTYTMYDEAGHWLGDYDSSGLPMQQVLWMDDLPVGLIANGGQLHYVEPDHLGSPRHVVEVERNIGVWSWGLEGEVFGASPPNDDADDDSIPLVFDMRFPGQRYDPASGLNYNYFRDYLPSDGRYLQSDPIGLEGGAATYSYTLSNPLIGSDPNGLLTLFFNRAGNTLWVIPGGGKPSYKVRATSGRPDCGECTERDRDKGPIPKGNYRLYAQDLSDPGPVGDGLRNLRADWGDWRVKLWPDEPAATFGRDGFYLHGGWQPGSAGCIDVGGGIFGDDITNRLANDISADPDGIIHVRVR